MHTSYRHAHINWTYTHQIEMHASNRPHVHQIYIVLKYVSHTSNRHTYSFFVCTLMFAQWKIIQYVCIYTCVYVCEYVSNIVTHLYISSCMWLRIYNVYVCEHVGQCKSTVCMHLCICPCMYVCIYIPALFCLLRLIVSNVTPPQRDISKALIISPISSKVGRIAARLVSIDMRWYTCICAVVGMCMQLYI